MKIKLPSSRESALESVPELPPLTLHPADVAWPTRDWIATNHTSTERTGSTATLLQDLQSGQAQYGQTFALVVIQGGKLCHAWYGPGHSETSTEPSWSMAKSITGALTGLMIGDGFLNLDDKQLLPQWRKDARGEITLWQLLTMRSGLEFSEDYTDAGASDVIEMLFGTGETDVAAFAANKPLAHTPGTHFSYSSGTTNILCRILDNALQQTHCGYEGLIDYARQRLFEPLGMRSAIPKTDQAGTFIGSSFCYCTAEDFARFGYLFLRDGVWEDRNLLLEGWVEFSRSPSALDDSDEPLKWYGAHWWLNQACDVFYASGYEGQRIMIAPEVDTVIVRNGKTPLEQESAMTAQMLRIIESLKSDPLTGSAR